jgi:hypothetical protein
VSKSEILVTVLLDGCKFEYSKYFRFNKYGRSLRLISKIAEPIGFEGIPPALWSGAYPEDSDIFTIFGFKINSPLRNLSFLHRISQSFKKRTPRRLRFLHKIIDQVVIKLCLKLLVPTQMCRGYERSNNILIDITNFLNPKRGYASLFDIPHYFLKYFWFYEDKIPISRDYLRPNLFEMLRKEKKNYVYMQNPVFNFSTRNRARIKQIYRKVEGLKGGRCDFACLSIATLDELGHIFGPDNRILEDTAKRIDEVLFNIWGILIKSYEKVTMIAHGDHGMVKVNKHVNLWAKLNQLQAKMEKDFIVFLNSSMAQFWFFNESSKVEISELLGSLECGRILTERDYEKYKMRFKDNKYGDLFWLADPGTLIYPNFFGWYIPVRGMHGYVPECEDNMGLLAVITNRDIKFKNNQNFNMVDIFPTICEIMNLPVPLGAGESMIAR